MKELIIKFLKQNWLKVGVAMFLIFVAFQDDLSFNINLNRPQKSPAHPMEQQQQVAKQEILSDLQLREPQEKQKTNRFNLNHSLWSRKKSPTKKSIN